MNETRLVVDVPPGREEMTPPEAVEGPDPVPGAAVWFLVPPTAPTVATTGPGPCRPLPQRSGPKRSVFFAMGTGTLKAWCTPCPVTGSGHTMLCSWSSHARLQTTNICRKESVRSTPQMAPGRSPAWTSWLKVRRKSLRLDSICPLYICVKYEVSPSVQCKEAQFFKDSAMPEEQ